MEPCTPARLHNKIARRKVQIVYYLHRRGGHVEHPHLVEGFLLPAQDGLHLKDFKNWLSALRGAGMPDSFSWSYKRSYKAGFIWQDLSNDDLIHPLQKNEYVLMGFELQQHALQGSRPCNCEQYATEGMQAGRRPVSSMEEAKLHELLKGGVMEYLNVSPLKNSSHKKTTSFAETIKADYKHAVSFTDSLEAENLQTTLAGFSDGDDGQQQHEVASVETSTDNVMLTKFSTLLRKQRSGEVKVYKAKEAEQTTDAATQTGESKRCSTEEAVSSTMQPHFSLAMSNQHHAVMSLPNSNYLPLFNPPRHHSVVDNGHYIPLKGGLLSEFRSSGRDGAATAVSVCATTSSNKSDVFYSPSSVHSSSTVLETASPGSARSLRSINSMNSTRFGSNNQMLGSMTDEHLHGTSSGGGDNGASSPLKGKRCSSTHLLKQFLSCGSIDISESSILSLKAMSLHSIPPGTPFNTSQAGTPMHFTQNRNMHSRESSPFRCQHYDDTSPPVTPKSWLCRPCGSHTLCTTPFEVHSPHQRSRSRPPSRNGSLKDMDVQSVQMTSCSPVESVHLERATVPPLLHISPPALSLSCASSPKQIRY